MNTILVVCVVAVTLAIIIAVIFLVRTLIQVRQTALQAEIFVRFLNKDMDALQGLLKNVTSFVDNFSSPWVKTGAWVTGFVSSWLSRRRQQQD